jgi:hypothetical protein
VRTSILLPAAVAVLLAMLLTGCPSKHDPDADRLKAELGVGIPLWVDVECKAGRPVFKDYSVLKLPDERDDWALVKLDQSCRIYGALVKKSVKKADMCDIRFRTRQELVPAGQRCACIAGRHELEEGRPTSKHCCEKFPDKPYCRDVTTPMPPVPPEVPPPEPAPEPEE